MSLFSELKRRNVIRVAMAYVVASWLIIQVVETILPAFGYSDLALRYVIIFLAVAFIPTLTFSWAFEITPEGLRREVKVAREHSITRFTGKRLDRLTMVLLALAVGYFSFDKFVLDPVEDVQIAETAHQEGRSEALIESYGDRSIAVLPFVNMSSDPEQEYFSDGISEELLNLLSKIPEMRVISRSSAFSFKGKEISIPAIATQLNVAYILEGSVRKAGSQVRITAQLIEARSDTHLWSETYDRELENIFVIQDEISTAIVRALKERLGLQLVVIPKMIAAANTEAHDAYLRGRYLVVQRTGAAVDAAVREFEKAISLHPDYALAHAELAVANLLQASYGDLTSTEAVARATPHAEKAMALNPNLTEAHAATGLLFNFLGENEKAMASYQRAIKINPSYSIVYTWLSTRFRNFVGDYVSAFAMGEMALRLDPLSFPARSNYIFQLFERNRLDDFDRELEKFVFTRPVDYAVIHGYRMAIGGQWSEYVLGCLDALKINPDERTIFAQPDWWLASLGLEEEALTYYENPKSRLLSLLGRHEDAVTVAEALLIKQPLSRSAKRALGMALASAGEYSRAGPILEGMWQRSGGTVTQSGIFSTSAAVALIAVRRDAGEEASTGELVTAIQDNVRRYHEAGITGTDEAYGVSYEAGLAAYLAGEHEKGLALIARGAEEGYFIPSGLAYLQTLYDDPDFASILAAQEDRQTRERTKFLDIVCMDNPYKDVWQPANDTCDRLTLTAGS